MFLMQLKRLWLSRRRKEKGKYEGKGESSEGEDKVPPVRYILTDFTNSNIRVWERVSNESQALLFLSNCSIPTI